MVLDRAINLGYWIPKRGMKKEGKMKVFVPEKFKRLSGLGLIRATFGPHYGARREAVQNIMRRTSGVALCAEDSCAVVFDGDQFRLCSKGGDRAYRTYWKRGKYYEEQIEESEDFRSLESLLKK